MGVCFFRSVRVAKVHLDQDCKGLGEFVWDFDLLKRAEERERGGEGSRRVDRSRSLWKGVKVFGTQGKCSRSELGRC